MSSLVQVQRAKYIDCVSAQVAGSKWKICILDGETEARLNSVLKSYDLLEHSVQQIERIDHQRAAFPRLDAVYILSPSPQNIDLIIRDFLPARPAQPATKRSPAVPASAGPKYANAHLFFIDAISDRDSDRLLQSPVRDYLKTFKEIFLSFWALEAQVFSLRRPDAFWTLYGPSSLPPKEAWQEWDASLEDMSQTVRLLRLV
jgi:syntaxin-binding protein 1